MGFIVKTLKYLLSLLAVIILLLFLFFGKNDIPVEKLKHTYAEPPSEFLAMDGMEVHYRDEGNTQGKVPVVLIHGTGASLHTFDGWAELLKNDFRVLRMDLPAFGLTGPFPNADYSIENYVTFIQHFLKAKGIEKCILGGNSLGGEIAWSFAAAYPEMVDRLILIDAAGYPIESESRPIAFTLAQIPVVNKALTYITPRSMVRSSVENVYADKSKVSKDLVERYFKLTLRTGNRQALVDRLTMETKSSKIELLKKINQPTLILWGEEDMLIPVENAYRFHQDLPNSTLSVLNNSGHVPMEENPEESLELLLDFLNNLQLSTF